MRLRSFAVSPLNSAVKSNPSQVGLSVPWLPIIRSKRGFMAEGLALLTFAFNFSFFSGIKITSAVLSFEYKLWLVCLKKIK